MAVELFPIPTLAGLAQLVASHKLGLPYRAGFFRAAPVALLLLAGPAFAQSLAQKGRTIALDACSACHQVTDDQKKPRSVFDPDQALNIRAPDFSVIAQRYDGNDRLLRLDITRPVHPMPEQQFNKADLDAIIAYIDSLRRPER